MAIIKCPSCNEKISDKSKVCSHCQYDFLNKKSSTGMNAEQLASQKKMKHIKRKYSLQMQAMISIIMVLGGALLWYLSGRGLSSLSAIGGIALLVMGSALYLTTRIRLILFRKSS